MANGLFFKQVSEIPCVKITTYTSKENTLTVQLKNGKERKIRCNDSLYYYVTNTNNHSKSKVNNYCVNSLNTLANNKLFFTKRQLKTLKLLDIYNNLLDGHHLTLSTHLSKKMINNSKVNMDDIQRGLNIYESPEPLLRVKITVPSQTQYIKSQV